MKIISRAALALILSCPFVVAVAGAGTLGLLRLQGKVKSVAADGAGFELQAKGGPYQVSLREFPTVTTLARAKLGDFDAGTEAHVLGRRLEATRHPTAGSTDCQVNSIHAFVVGPFVPPRVAEDLAKKNVAWHKGSISKRSATVFVLGDMVIQGGPDRDVVAAMQADREAIVQKAIVFLEAERADASKPKELSARRVVVIQPNVPATELQYILGLN